MKDVRLGESVYCEQCDRYHPFGMHVEDTMMLKVPTHTELFLMQLEFVIEKMSAKTEPDLWKEHT